MTPRWHPRYDQEDPDYEDRSDFADEPPLDTFGAKAFAKASAALAKVST